MLCHLSLLSVAADTGGSQHLFEGRGKVFASDDVVFAWAIGKALLIVIVSCGSLLYVAWAVTWQKKNEAHIGTDKDGGLKYENSVKAGKVVLIANGTTEEARCRNVG